MKVIRIPLDIKDECTVHEIQDAKDLSIEESGKVLNQMKQLIGIEWAEVVVIHIRPSDPRRDYCLIVDEVGKLKDGWRMNIRASQFYPGTLHGDPIAGNAILCAREWTDSFGECDLAGLEDNEIAAFMKYL